MLVAALLMGLQTPSVTCADADQDACREILDYRGRVERCPNYKNGGPPDWRCGDLAADERRLRQRFSSRPDLLKLLALNSWSFNKDIVLRSYEWWQFLPSEHVRHVMRDRKGREYAITADMRNDALQRVTLRLPGQRREFVITLGERVAYPDLQTLRARILEGRTIIELNYGSERPWCFESDTGQPKLSFYLPTPGRLEVWAHNNEGCRDNSRKIAATLTSRRY